MWTWLAFSVVSVFSAESQVSPTSSPFQTWGVNLASEFLAEQEIGVLNESQWEELKKYRIILIPGFLSDTVRQVEGWVGPSHIAPQAFQDEMEKFDKRNIDYLFLKTRTELKPDVSASIILTTIANSSKPVIILSHSRGGLDFLEALLEAGSETLAKVRGWISFQAPFHGTPLADEFIQNPLLRWLAQGALHEMGGDFETVLSMSIPRRREYMRFAESDVQEILNEIPMISVAAWKPNTKGIDSRFEIPRDFMEMRGFQTDGMVPWQSAVLPGAGFVLLKGVDHSATVYKSPQIDREIMMGALIRMLQKRMAYE